MRVQHQGYQFLSRSVNLGVDNRHVELLFSRELDLGRGEPAFSLLLGLGPAPHEAADGFAGCDDIGLPA